MATVIGLMVLSLLIAGYLLANQRVNPPWVSFYEVSAEFEEASSVSPGQGQSVTIAGVNVGQISGVSVSDGRAVIDMKIEDDHAPIYKDATFFLRPRTGLKDMYVQMDPGTPEAGTAKEGTKFDIAHSTSTVNERQFLAALDADTRDYIELLVGGLGEGLKGNADRLRELFKQFDSTNANLQRANGAIADRRRDLAVLVTELGKLSEAVAEQDDSLSRSIDQGAATFSALAKEDASIRETLRRLAPTLKTVRKSLDKGQELADVLGPASEALKEPARELGPALRASEPFLEDATPIVRDELRPFTRAARPAVKQLRRASKSFKTVTPDLADVFSVLQELGNETAYNPTDNGPNEQVEGFGFWVAWFYHNSASFISTQDGNGAMWRGQVVADCATINNVRVIQPVLYEILQLPACTGAR